MNNNSFEIERKYLIKYPNKADFKDLDEYNELQISQTYLNDYGSTRGIRIRKSYKNQMYIYTKTYKEDITPVKRIEIEDEITKEEYESLLKYADKKLKTIEKTRFTFLYKKQLFELDIYPFWSDRAILELELADEKEEVILPPFIEIIKEVTSDKRYRNHSLAKKNILEPIDS